MQLSTKTCICNCDEGKIEKLRVYELQKCQFLSELRIKFEVPKCTKQEERM